VSATGLAPVQIAAISTNWLPRDAMTAADPDETVPLHWVRVRLAQAKPYPACVTVLVPSVPGATAAYSAAHAPS
jgi:hypothetical protein